MLAELRKIKILPMSRYFASYLAVPMGFGRLTWMKAVAMITPDPKYLVMKNASGGTRIRFVRAAAMGRRAPE